MSLLMQALKKAEHAKQKQSTSPAADSAADNNPPASKNEEISLSLMEAEKSPASSSNLDTLGLELTPTAQNGMAASPPPDAGPADPARHNLEADDKLLPGQPQPARNPRFETENRSSAEEASQQLSAKMRLEQQKTAALETGKRKAEQEKAKTVFASKQPNPNRRTLWIAVVGLTIVALFLGAGYYYLQIAPQNSSLLVKTLPIQTAPATAGSAPSDPAPNQGTGEQTAANQDSEAVPKQAPRTRRTTTSGTTPPEQIPPRRRQQPVAGDNNIEFRQTTTDAQVSPALGKAYQFFLQGDLASAQQQYQIALRQEPNNRDALLGLAAIAVSRNQSAQAGSYYLKLVELDPSDPDAIAGITSLQGGDPFEMESRLKRVLVQHPQAGAIMFALGNLYARQSRWSDAQQAYFNAYGTATRNPDYAFNLAVSLDRLNQEKLALEYYERALNLAQSRPGTLNITAVQNRINELQSAAGVK